MPTNDPLSLSFRTFVQEQMERQQISPRDLADRLGVTRQAIDSTLKADGAVRTSTMVDVLDALGFRPDLKFRKRPKEDATT